MPNNEKIMRVIRIDYSVAQRSNKYINVITFEDENKVPYVAEEPSEIANHSRFTQGKVQSLRVSFPANTPGKKDWVEYLGDSQFTLPVENLSVAVAAFNHVSKNEFGLADQDLLMRTIEVGTIIKNAAQML